MMQTLLSEAWWFTNAMKCIGGVIRILHPDSKGLGKCRKRVTDLIRRRAKISSVFCSINVEAAHGSQAKISALEVTWRAGSWVQTPWWWWLGSHGMCKVVLMHSEMETVGHLLGREQWINTVGDLKVKSGLKLLSNSGAFEGALRYSCIHFASRKRSCTISPLQCRGKRQTVHRHVFSLFFSFSPAIEFSTFFILN